MTIVLSRSSAGYRLYAEQFLPAPLDRVFPYFADAMNLQALTPKYLHFQILTPAPIVMRQGSKIDYQLRIHGFPVRWQSEITDWEPPRRFVDRQIRGPYRWWIHEHHFEQRDDQTRAIDTVEYGVPLGALLHPLLVGPDLRRIFEHRAAVLRRVFGPAPCHD
ncbi:MAG TPA: SRPBCC family protein [Pirellulaceae bacterium]